MICKEKVFYHSATQAEAARLDLIAIHKTNKANARLVVYRCRDCGLFHLGHLRREQKPQAAPEIKPPSASDLRRAEKHKAKVAARKAERAERYRDWKETLRHIEWMIDQDFAARAK